ncbi:ras guanine nucleotide exchange factor domain-containing protein [Fennellomyces sp. T-0311]|nr:ras guanine nucleotide exchange factor domain-containing protein [Fennellomyces sp. T-0311]
MAPIVPQPLCRVRAVYAFQSKEPSSLSFQPGALIDVLSQVESGWWLGCTAGGIPGWFPKDYVEVLEPQKPSNTNVLPTQKPDQGLDIDPTLPPKSTTTPNNDEWTVQLTEDGEGQYLFNPVTGEMRFTFPEDQEDDDDDDSFRDASDQSWLHEYEEEGAHIDEEIEFVPQKLPSPWSQYVIPTEHEHLFTDTQKHGDPRTPLTWEILSTCTAITIHNLNAAVQANRKQLYFPYATAVVNAIKLMMIACGAVDKEWFQTIQNKDLQVHHRSTVAGLAKMMLTAIALEREEVDKDRLVADAREVLVAIRSFVTTCQTIPLRLRSNLEVLLDPPVYSNARAVPSTISTILEDTPMSPDMLSPTPPSPHPYREHRENSTSSSATYSTAKTAATRATSVYSSGSSRNDDEFEMPNWNEMIQSYSMELQASVHAMLTILSQHKHQRDALAALLLARLDHLSQRAGQLIYAAERVCFDNAEQQVVECKHELLHGFGILFCKLQAMTDATIPVEDAVLSVELVIQRIRKPVDKMVALCARVARENKQTSSQRGSLVIPVEDMTTYTEKQSGRTERDYMGYDYKPEEIVFSTDGQIKGGTLRGLVERLTLHDQSDTKFIQAFLLTYRAFCTSEELLERLKARFNIKPPADLTQRELDDWKESKQKLIRLRVFNVFKHWVEHYMNVEEDQAALNTLLDFTNTTLRSSISFSANQLERLIRKRLDADPLRKLVVMAPRDQPTPILPRNVKKFRLLDVHPLEMARQLTMMDFGLYRAIQPSECLDKAWSSSDKNKSIHIRESIEYNNQVTLWVSDAILCQMEIKKRANTIKYWVQVAEKCHSLHSFNTCMAILSAFESSAIARLQRTWELVGSRAQQSLDGMRKLFASNRNFAEYRTLVHSVNPPCIPFLGVYLQDLTFIEDGNPNVLKNTDLINFGKLAKTSEVIREIQQYQSTPYPFLAVSMLQMFIKANLQSARDDETLYSESLRIEPKERTDEKVTRLLEESGFI